MTALELAGYVCKGLLMLVGQVRAADVRESGYVDTNSGLATKSLVISYFVELRGALGFEVVRLTRRLAPTVVDPALAPTHVEIGKTYAFEIVSFERKSGIAFARLSLREPEEIEFEGQSAAAPPGAVVV